MASPRGKAELKEEYESIFNTIQTLGHENITGFVLDVEVEKFYLSDIKKFYDHTVADLKKADICVFETSIPSLAIGHLISMAIELGKPVVALYTGNNIPFFLKGVEESDDKLQVVSYTSSNVNQELANAIDYASDQQDTRFNFFISPKHQNYLDWIAKERKIPRAVYLRRLIEKDMEKNRDYNQ